MKYSKEWLRENELKKILNNTTISEKYEIWILLMYTPALRVSEALNVRVRDLDFENECIEIYGGKGKDDTEMQKAPCNISVLKRLKRYAEHSDLRPKEYIMFSQKKKKASRFHVYNVLNKLCSQAGIDKKIGTHTLRRSRAEHLLDRGLSLTYVSRFLRHKNLATTMAYLDVSTTDIQREMSKIDDSVEEIL
ncbi:integrase family protein [Methanohalobium evestigatum Z-7303]|uniref:Integrase family protein n=1 Tax=Methanohalobium evestigatum (strain ATCC BAA-1072 / DSM 3721 / NBRC 107634 / OCM 161 / Z-7303) TaxID=644295 RepID=D7E6N7_METEZ|nr:site-specific integrase [Methanohalobium evestigatum]ADI73259.1 integrase family protein [Methanohalobium evestigatum Z-7303]